MKNFKKNSLLTGSIVAGALLSVSNVEAANLLDFQFLGTGAQLRSQLLSNAFTSSLVTSAEGLKSIEATCGDKKDDAKAKDATCGANKKAEAKAKDGKCGEGKCGEGKCGGKKAKKGKKVAEAKAKDGKCGEGKCGDKKAAK